MMQLTVIGTGSAGNAYLLRAESQGGALLLDAGLTAKQIIRAARGLRGIQGVLITHEHNDHIRGAAQLIQMGLPVYATVGTWAAAGIDPSRTVVYLKPFKCGDFTAMPIETQHDAQQPCGYIVRYEKTGETLLYATDTYYLRNTYPGINYWLIECNYCDDICDELEDKGELPTSLRNRLMKSHMSLRRLKSTLAANDLTETRKIVLCHLSDERSDEERMVREISAQTSKDIQAASNGMTIDLSMTPF